MYTDCVCAGTFADSDGDGICDAEDCDSDTGTMGTFEGDVFLMDSCSGVIMTTASGDCHKMVINSNGELSTIAVSCPE